MARRWTAGAEIGLDITASPWDGDTSGSVTRDTTTVRSGSASYKCDSAAGAAAHFSSRYGPAASTTSFLRMYMNTSATPSSEVIIMQPFAFDANCSVKMTTSGTLTLYVNNVQQGSASGAVNDGTWHRVELSVTCNATNITAAELKLDGTSVATSSTSISVSFGDMFFGWKENPGASKVMYVDDCALNDSTGSQQTSWPGSGSVVVLKSISDSAVGTGWTNDNASTTNMYASVSAVPPAGIADTTSGGGGHQIRNATSNANVNYDANLTTYTDAGIGSSDTITLLQPVVNTSAPVSTSAKQGTFGISSNPVIANVSLGALGTSGAFWGGTPAAGTWATGWQKWSSGTVTYAPTVTLGNSPVARITQVTSSTRIAMVDWIGMYVEYVPATADAFTAPKIVTETQAVMRSVAW